MIIVTERFLHTAFYITGLRMHRTNVVNGYYSSLTDVL